MDVSIQSPRAGTLHLNGHLSAALLFLSSPRAWDIILNLPGVLLIHVSIQSPCGDITRPPRNQAGFRVSIQSPPARGTLQY